MTIAIAFDKVSKRFILHREQRKSFQERISGLLRPRGQGEEFWALRDVSFELAAGQSLGLVGHNGAGKSTALKLMTRILEPSSGTVTMQGRVAALLELGSGFHPDLSGRENVYLYGSLMGFGRREMDQRMDEIVDFSGIGDFVDMEVKHYSSGMYTRLGFAVATSVDPDILITDEVLAVGDEAFQRKCLERIYEFRQRGKTIIFVSHALETVRSMCDLGVWLDHGSVRASGPVAGVVDAYLEDVNRREIERIATTQPHLDPQDQNRFGSREIEIESVEMLNGAGEPASVFRTHEALTIRMHYLVHQPVQSPVFGIGLHHESGLWLSGPNTRFDGLELPELQGSGYVDYHIPVLPLLNGRYMLSVAVYDSSLLHAYDHHDRRYRLIVQGAGLREHYGIIAVSGSWQLKDEG